MQFGTGATSTLSEEETEKAKMRAERFGVPVKTAGGVLSPEEEAKKQKRAERFGGVGATMPVDPDEEERRKKRMARFGNAA